MTSNPFTSGPYTVGDHTVTIGDFTGPFTILACEHVTVVATCSATDSPTASVTFSGVTVGDDLDVMDSTYALPVTSNPFVVSGVGVSWGDTYVETNGVTTIASGTFSVAACAVF